jgi:hypothetical protein
LRNTGTRLSMLFILVECTDPRTIPGCADGRVIDP